MMRRSQMRPGQKFVVREWRIVDRRGPGNYRKEEFERVLVVIDEKTEVEFWEGGTWAMGDTHPSVWYEVVP